MGAERFLKCKTDPRHRVFNVTIFRAHRLSVEQCFSFLQKVDVSTPAPIVSELIRAICGVIIDENMQEVGNKTVDLNMAACSRTLVCLCQ